MKYKRSISHVDEHRDLFLSNIHLLESFVEPETCRQIIDKSVEIANQNDDYQGYGTRYFFKEPLPEILSINERITNFASATYGRTLVLAETTKIRSLPPKEQPHSGDGYMHAHCDSEHIEKDEIDLTKTFITYEMEITPLLNEVTAILYLNDNFDGGEIEFYEYNKIIKPKSGMLLLFPSGNQYLHRVKPVASGKRFFCTIFLTQPKLLFLFNQLNQNQKK